MHRLFLGCNLWCALFMTGAVLLGASGNAWHQRLAIFAAVFACLVQSAVVALFLGAAKLIKEHVGRFSMPLSFIDRLNEVYHRLIPLAAFGVTLTAAASILGGAADLGRAPMWLHVMLAVTAWLYLLAVIPIEYRLHEKVHRLVTDVERSLPAPGRADEVMPLPGFRPDQVVLDRMGRARALLYVGLTIPLPYFGYTFISGQDVSWLILPTISLATVCFAGAVHQYRGARPRV